MAVPAAALVQLGVSAYQFYQGEKQRKEAEKLKNSNYVPPSVKESVAMARMDANATMGPGSKRGLEKLTQASATAVENAKRAGGSPGQVQQAVADINAREGEAIKDLAVNDASYRAARRHDLREALGIQGQYEKMSKDAGDAAKSALTGASKQNKYNALSSLAEGVVYGLPDSAFDSSLGGNGTGTTPPADTKLRGEQMRRGLGQASVTDWSGRYPQASFGIRGFDYNRYLRELNMNRFQTGI